jgi:hypothetical protein
METALVLLACKGDMSAYGGFVWPEVGMVECADWNPRAACGNGLHGALWGEGDGGLFCWDEDAKWLVVLVETSTIVDLAGKVKFPRGDVVYCGDRHGATEYLIARLPRDRPYMVIAGTATAGYSGTATAGYSGTATAGYSGTATAGDSGTATAGDSGTATAGDRGTIMIRWYDSAHDRYRISIGYVGEKWVEANKAYRLNEVHEFVCVEE